MKAVSYTDRKGREWDLAALDDEERKLVGELLKRAEANPDWYDFENYRTRAVASLYDGRGVPRKESSKTAVYKIAQDLSGRLAVAQGLARRPNCWAKLEAIVRNEFKT